MSIFAEILYMGATLVVVHKNNDMDNIKIMMVDDFESSRSGIRMMIKYEHPDIEIIGEAKSGAELFRLLERVGEPDVLLLDISLPDMSGVEIAKRLKEERPELKILVVSCDTSVSTIEELLHIGIDGFVSKEHDDTETTIEAIRSVKQGFNYFGRDISKIISSIYISQKKQKQVTSEFTEQERRIIECCHEGLSAKLIADRLFLSINTVQWHKANIFRKLGFNTTYEMVQYALKNKIIRTEW